MNTGESDANSDHICRTCLSNNGDMKSLLSNSEESRDILLKLSSVLHSEIILDMSADNLCHDCEDKLNISYDFQRLAKKSQEFLLNRSNKEAGGDRTDNSVVDNIPEFINEELEINSNDRDESCSNISSDDVDDSVDDIKCKQNMRLTQYSKQEVEYIISMIQERHMKESTCIYCRFCAKDSRALSVHMSKVHKFEKDHWCSLCNTEYVNLPLHIYNDHKEDLKCPLCSKVLNKTSHLIEHLYCHSRKRKFVCDTCNKSFISSRHLKMHQKVHSKSKYCQICGKQFKTKGSLCLHMKIHYDCKQCDCSFTSLDTLETHKCSDNAGKLHQNDGSESQPQNYCTECDKKVRSLKNHRELHHSQKTKIKHAEKPALCPYCGKRFRFVSKLSIHLRSHTGEKPYLCGFCERRFATRSHLIDHERTHTGEKPHVCSVCGKGFTQTSILKTHMRIHTGKTVACLLCPKKFCRPSELKQHMRTHSGEKPYACKQCDSAFKQRSHLVEHSRTHNNDRPYQCEFCDKSFKKMNTLKIHSNVHSADKEDLCYIPQLDQHTDESRVVEKPHKCAVCLESFASLSLFTSHYANNHDSLTTATAVGMEATFVDVLSTTVEPSAEHHFSNN